MVRFAVDVLYAHLSGQPEPEDEGWSAFVPPRGAQSHYSARVTLSGRSADGSLSAHLSAPQFSLPGYGIRASARGEFEAVAWSAGAFAATPGYLTAMGECQDAAAGLSGSAAVSLAATRIALQSDVSFRNRPGYYGAVRPGLLEPEDLRFGAELGLTELIAYWLVSVLPSAVRPPLIESQFRVSFEPIWRRQESSGALEQDRIRIPWRMQLMVGPVEVEPSGSWTWETGSDGGRTRVYTSSVRAEYRFARDESASFRVPLKGSIRASLGWNTADRSPEFGFSATVTIGSSAPETTGPE
jgi:hypothetical protein